jgi:hypothetical protein
MAEDNFILNGASNENQTGVEKSSAELGRDSDEFLN